MNFWWRASLLLLFWWGALLLLRAPCVGDKRPLRARGGLGICMLDISGAKVVFPRFRAKMAYLRSRVVVLCGAKVVYSMCEAKMVY